MFAKKCAMHGHIVLVKQYLMPLNNILRSLKGLNEQALAPINVFTSNVDLLQELMTNNSVQIDFENLLMLELTSAFYARDMERARRLVGMIGDNVTVKPLVFNTVMMDFYAGLTNCHLARESGDISHAAPAEQLCEKIKWFVTHSKWNFESKFKLLQAECLYTKGSIDAAAASYEAAIKSAKEHKFVNELALSCECAAHFYKDLGNEAKSVKMFKQAKDAYTKWGAAGKAKSLPPCPAILNAVQL